jgi:hypothetical protein
MMHGWGLGGIMDGIWGVFAEHEGVEEQNDFFFLSLT